MSINSIEYAKKFTSELDKAYTQKAVTGFFADNILRSKFVGAKTVIVPDLDFVGLVNYDRTGGFNRAMVTVAQTPFTMSMDRARSISIDREDMDESGITDLAGKVLGEYVRTQVVPETDAYVLSKLAGIANENNQKVTYDSAKPYETLVNLVNKVRNVAGFEEELVCFVNGNIMSDFELSPELQKMITVSNFKQGEINLNVKTINGVPIIPVTPERMKTAYSFVESDDTHSAGGFSPDADAKNILMLVLPKKAASLVKKTEKIRIFTPEQNVDADAYKFDYRIYYDVFVKKSALGSIYASFEA